MRWRWRRRTGRGGGRATLPQEAEFQHQPNRKATDESLGAGLLALDVREEDGPDTPTAPGLLEYATRLGRTADRLARLDTLPTAATVLAELGALTVPPGAVDWDERRMVELAAAASVNAAATPRLEIYPRDLPLVRRCASRRPGSSAGSRACRRADSRA